MHLGFIDSGIGGLTTLSEAVDVFPSYKFSYVADTRYAPYGSLPPEVLQSRIRELIAFLTEKGVDAIVLACNTAGVSSFDIPSEKPIIRALPELRLALSSTAGKVLMLSTPTTASSDYVEERKNPRLRVFADKHLAGEIELASPNFESLTPYVFKLIRSFFPLEGIVLACTHYLFLKPFIQKEFPDLKLFDSNDRIIREISELPYAHPSESGVQLYYT